MYNKKTAVMIPCGYCGTMNLGKKWCGNKCSSAQWRIEHPYKTQKVVTEKICGFDGIKRDKQELWIRYMKRNPEYYKMVML